MDHCIENPCQNNGSCKNIQNNYTCDCGAQFGGLHCEGLNGISYKVVFLLSFSKPRGTKISAVIDEADNDLSVCQDNRPFSLAHFVFPLQITWNTHEDWWFILLTKKNAYKHEYACMRSLVSKTKDQTSWVLSKDSVLGKQNVKAKKVYCISCNKSQNHWRCPWIYNITPGLWIVDIMKDKGKLSGEHDIWSPKRS